jgi:hypothetical protein
MVYNIYNDLSRRVLGDVRGGLCRGFQTEGAADVFGGVWDG